MMKALYNDVYGKAPQNNCSDCLSTLASAIAALPYSISNTMFHHYICNQSCDDIAVNFNVHPATVQRHLAVGVAMIKAFLGLYR